jgi:ribosome production factor 1
MYPRSERFLILTVSFPGMKAPEKISIKASIDVSTEKQTCGIKNKLARSRLYTKVKREKKCGEKKLRDARKLEQDRAFHTGESALHRKLPKTIENQRSIDDSFILTNDKEAGQEDAEDEFANYFDSATNPKIIITTSRKPSRDMFRFLKNIFDVLPKAYYYSRRAYSIQEIVNYAKVRGFTNLLVFNENRKFSHGSNLNGLLHVHLPDGPTCLYRLSSVVLSKKIRNHGRSSNHFPELILNNFSTRLGHRIGRMFASLFPQMPEFGGRRVVTFHNQRDFIFFRHHRYIFDLREENQRGYTLKESLTRTRQERVHVKGKSILPDEVHDAVESNSCCLGPKNGAKFENKSSHEGNLPKLVQVRIADDERSTNIFKGNVSGNDVGKRSVSARLQELGPRFTLKLLSVQKGTFSSRRGEYEYTRHSDVDETRHNRRKFVL